MAAIHQCKISVWLKMRSVRKLWQVHEACISFTLSTLLVGALMGTHDLDATDRNYGVGDSQERETANDSSRPPIHVGFIATNIETRAGLKFKMQLVELLKSILDRSTARIHFVLFSDETSTPTILRIAKRFAHLACATEGRRGSCPTFGSFRLSAIVDRFGSQIASLRPHFTATDDGARKGTSVYDVQTLLGILPSPLCPSFIQGKSAILGDNPCGHLLPLSGFISERFIRDRSG